jgi:hypothetical protein
MKLTQKEQGNDVLREIGSVLVAELISLGIDFTFFICYIPPMAAETPTPNLEAQLAALQKRNVWLERQLALEKAGVPENYVKHELGVRTLAELAQLSPERQAKLFWRVAMRLERASVAKTFVGAAEYAVTHNLEWNGEEPHPTWKELSVEFQHVSERVMGTERTAVSGLSSWTIMTALRHDGTEDTFSLRTVPLNSFRVNRTPILALRPDSEGRVDEAMLNQGISQEKAAELLDFARGVRGGFEVFDTRYVSIRCPIN